MTLVEKYITPIKPFIDLGQSFGADHIQRVHGVPYQKAIECVEEGVNSGQLNRKDELHYVFANPQLTLHDLSVAHQRIFDNLNAQYASSCCSSKMIFICSENVAEQLYYLDTVCSIAIQLFDVNMLPFIAKTTITII